jgi:pseudouridine-5'-phosphate glycosidase
MSPLSPHLPVVISDEVSTALLEKRPVVALETTIISHGLPFPKNREVADLCEAAVRASGSVPATIGIIDGVIHVGLSASQVDLMADPSSSVTKASTRDLGVVVARGLHGATTVAGTISIARHVGIDVMATGGLGGVHRGASESFDESHDLVALSRTSVVVVASGCKSILDVGATLERLDTLGVGVVGYQTDSFPGFYRHSTEFAIDWRSETAAEIARIFDGHREISGTALVVANPVPLDRQLDEALHDAALAEGLRRVAAGHVTGKAVTPVLLSAFAEFTSGVSVTVNTDLVVNNSIIAGQIAAELASR